MTTRNQANQGLLAHRRATAYLSAGEPRPRLTLRLFFLTPPSLRLRPLQLRGWEQPRQQQTTILRPVGYRRSCCRACRHRCRCTRPHRPSKPRWIPLTMAGSRQTLQRTSCRCVLNRLQICRADCLRSRRTRLSPSRSAAARDGPGERKSPLPCRVLIGCVR